jgi:undecaprenyl-diphosphatase
MFETLEHIDRYIFLAINGANSSFLDILFWQISEGWVLLPLWVFIVWYLVKQKGLKFLLITLLFSAFVILFCDQSSNMVKHAVERYRPTHNLEIKEQIHILNDYRGGQFGFFSSHAANAMGMAVFLFLIMTGLGARQRCFIFLWPLVVGYSRIYLGVHYPSDILFGLLDGLLWGIVFFKAFQFFNRKFNAE